MSFPFIAALGYKAAFTEYVGTNTFNLGQLGMTEDGTFYRLSKAGAALTNPTRAKINANTHLSGLTGHSLEAALASAIAVGDTDFTVTDATNARDADYYKGGYAAQPRSDGDGTIPIVKSGKEVSDTYKIYVPAPFQVTNSQGNTVHVYPSLYGNIKTAAAYSQGYEQFAGCINAPITSGYYFWMKVKGPNWVGVTSTWPGAASKDRLCVWHLDGTIKMADEAYNGGTSEQIAGYLIQSGNYGDVLLMLDMW